MKKQESPGFSRGEQVKRWASGRVRAELAGLDLMCWCPLTDVNGVAVPCHADLLLAIANGGQW